MYFIILATDKPNAIQIRQQARPAHLDYIAGFGTQIVAAGATLSDDGTAMTGSFILVTCRTGGRWRSMCGTIPT